MTVTTSVEKLREQSTSVEQRRDTLARDLSQAETAAATSELRRRLTLAQEKLRERLQRAETAEGVALRLQRTAAQGLRELRVEIEAL